ncbi:MAG: adenosylcobinamide-GDP ribazoletransferase [Lachnospiraceae bacterium]|nr:adenosylcobinamide-GDP ribazoletransferase [Lachnospiraceae bacterium]
MSSFIIAFAMYSKIPMPKVTWNEKNMRYAICYFPLIGVVIALLEVVAYRLCEVLQCTPILRGILLTVIPLLVTGGIHMDGFLDTVDARSSYGDRVKKLEILKDPHTGAFAIIKGILYIILQVGFFSEISWQGIVIYSWIFMLSRAMSGFALANFRGAKKDGLLATFAKGANKTVVTFTMVLYYVLGITGFVIAMVMKAPFMDTMGVDHFQSMSQILLLILLEMAVYGCTILVFWYYHSFSYREFGGITGDLAGYFVQILELVTLITIVIIEKVWIWSL